MESDGKTHFFLNHIFPQYIVSLHKIRSVELILYGSVPPGGGYWKLQRSFTNVYNYFGRCVSLEADTVKGNGRKLLNTSEITTLHCRLKWCGHFLVDTTTFQDLFNGQAGQESQSCMLRLSH